MKKNQRANRANGQSQRDGDAQIWHEKVFVRRTNRAQNEDAKQKRRRENAQNELIGAVAHEISQKSRPKLRRRERERRDGRRKHHARDGNHRTGNRAQNAARAFAAARPDKALISRPIRAVSPVEFEQKMRTNHRAQRHQSGHNPIRIAHVFEKRKQPRLHRGASKFWVCTPRARRKNDAPFRKTPPISRRERATDGREFAASLRRCFAATQSRRVGASFRSFPSVRCGCLRGRASTLACCRPARFAPRHQSARRVFATRKPCFRCW